MQKKCLRCGEPTRPDRERCSRCNSVLEGQTPFINSASQSKPDNGIGLLISLMVVVAAVILGTYMTFFRTTAKPVPVAVAPPPTEAPKKESVVLLNSNSSSNTDAASRTKMLKEMDDRAKAAANANK